ncbi:general stress protein [Cellulomonas sp. NPDC089187]|uniref:general stress protein n=1 Tax=Cellulomonas sp. NPDC089187 TaxID=3154970 RepID=UPI00342B5120
MSFPGGPRVPQTPTLPQGETVASYGTYLEAQRAVDHLSDRQFPVQLVTIVGTDLKMVERVTGRLSYPRVALSGFLSGVWFGLFIGLLFMLTSNSLGILLVAMFVGGGFGLLFGVVSYAITGGKRDFTSQSQIVASQYAVLCAVEKAHEARNLLREVGAVRVGPTAPAAPAAPVGVPPSDPRTAYGQPGAPAAAPQPGPAQPRPAEPRYGQYAAPAPAGQPQFAPVPTADPQGAPSQPAADTTPVDPGERPQPRYGQYAPPPESPEDPQQR